MCSERDHTRSRPLGSSELLSLEARELPWRIALISLDVETDYGTGRTQALSQIQRFIDVMRDLNLAWTAFVEGQLFETQPALCRQLAEAGVDVQVHCYDHTKPGDTAESLARSAARYADAYGRRPRGYRAHTYRLTTALFEALLANGFAWDSSLMRGFAQGRNADPKFRRGDYLVLNGRLFEFPIATWDGLGLPFNHAHALMFKTPGVALLEAISRLPRLVVYNCHMTDLVRCDSLRAATRTRTVRLLHRYIWSTQGESTFAMLRRIIARFQQRQYTFLASDALYCQLLEAEAERSRS